MKPAPFALIRILSLAALVVSTARLNGQDETARKLYEVLLKRPAAGPVLDQFQRAWMESDTLEKLETWLRAQADKSPDARMVLAAFLARRGSLDQAVEEWQRVSAEAPLRPDVWLALAEHAVRMRHENEAVAAIRSGLAAAPDAAGRRPFLELQARFFARSQRQAEARKVWDELLRLFPDDQDLREDFVELLAAAGDTDAAVKAARELAAATTDAYRRVLRRMRAGDLLARQGAAEAALAEYRAALRDTGADSWLERDLLRQMESVLRRADRVSDLTAFMEKLGAEEPQRLAVRRRVAQLFAEQGNREDADRVWRALLAAAPGERELAEGFIQSLTEAARHTEAAEQWRALLRHHPADAELHLRLAAAHAAAGESAAATAAVKSYIVARSSTDEAMLRGGAELLRLKLPAAAAAVLTEAVQKFPDSEQAALQLAAALFRAERRDEARAAWRKAAEKHPLPAARAAAAAGEHVLAWELLAPRADSFAADTAALTFLCDTAGAAEQWPAALLHAQRLLALAADAPSLEHAGALVARCAEQAGQSDALRRDLESRRAALTIPEKLLLADLLHAAGMRSAAVVLVDEAATAQPALSLATLVRLHARTPEWNAAVLAQTRLHESESPPRPATAQRLAELCTAAGRHADALRWTAEWRRLAPGSTTPWLAEATLLTKAGRSKEAGTLLEQASFRWPEDAAVLERLAVMYSETGRAPQAQDILLRLYEMAEGTEAKLRRLPALIRNAQSTHRLDGLTEEFERRRAQNRLSPVPLLALAELAREQSQPRRRLELLHEAARLGTGDAALLLRTAEAAAAEGFTDLALSILTEAAAMDKTGAAQQQRAYLLLRAGRETEAGAILAQSAASLTLEEAGELAAVLAQQYPTAAAHLLGGMLERFPDNYRVAWLRVELLALNRKDAGLVEEYLRLATTSFPPLPTADAAYHSGQPAWPPPGGPTFEPDVEWHNPPDTFAEVRVTRAFLEDWPQRQNRERAADHLPPVPGHPLRLRGWAARRALSYAHLYAPDTLPAAKERLLKAGVTVALLADSVIGHSRQPDRAEVDRLYAQHPEHRAWVLRYLYGEVPLRFGELSFSEAAMQDLQPDYLAAQKNDVPRPSLAEAWRVFRESDPAFAVYVALQSLPGPDPVQRGPAEEALALLSQPGGPGAALRGAVPHLGTSIFNRDAPPDSVPARLASHLDAWAASAPPGPAREELQALRVQRDANTPDPAAYLRTVAAHLEESGTSHLSKIALAAWPVPAAPPHWPERYQSITDLKSQMYAPQPQGLDWPMVSDLEKGHLPGPGPWLLQSPPVVPTHAQGRLLRAVTLLVPGKWSEDAAKLRAALEACNDAGLKAAASLSLPDAGFTTACMDALTSAADAPPDAFLLAAAWAWRQHQPEKAVPLLERYSAQEPDNAPRLADTGIVAASHLLLWAGEPVPEVVRRAAAAALERLTAHAFQPDLLRGMARVAAKLALPEHATALLAAASSAHPPLPPAHHINPVSPPNALTGLIESLQRGPERPQEDADKLPDDPAAWVQSLLDQAKMSADEWGQRPQPNMALNSWTLKERKSLQTVVVKDLRRLADHAPLPRDRWFAAFALLGCEEAEFAAAALRRACALMPEEKKLHYRAASYLASTGQIKTAKALTTGLSRYQRAAVLSAAITSHHKGVARLSAVLDLADEWLAALRDLHDHADSISDEDRVDAINNSHGAQQVLEALESKQMGRELPGLAGFLETPTEEHLSAIEEDAELAALSNRRRELLTAIYRELIRSPFLSATGFTKMASAARVHKIDWPEMLDDALRTLLISPAMHMHWYFDSGQYAPQQVVLRELVRRPAWLEETVLPALRQAKKDQLAGSLVRLAPLLTCGEAEFVRLVEKNGGPSQRESRADYGTTVREIIKLRGLTGVLPELIAREVQEQLEEWYGSLGMTKMIGPALDLLYARGGQAALDAWVQSMCGEGQAEDFWSRPVSPEAMPGAGFLRLLSAVPRAGQSGPEVVTAYRFRRALRQAAAALPVRARARYLMPVEPPSPAAFSTEDKLALLETLGLTGSAAEFCAALENWRTPGAADGPLGVFGQWLLQSDPLAWAGEPGQLAAALMAKHPAAFGAQFCAALLQVRAAADTSSPVGNVSALRVLGAHLTDLKALPEPEQRKLLLPSSADHITALVSESAAQQWQREVAARRDRRRLDDLLAKDAAEILLDPAAQAEVNDVTRRLLAEEPDRVIALLQKILTSAAGSPQHSGKVLIMLQFVPESTPAGGDASASARWLKTLLKMSAAEPALGFPAGAWPQLLQETLRRWLMTPALSGPGAPAQKLPPLQRFLAGVESSPAGLLTDAETHRLLPLLLASVHSFTELSDGDVAVPAAAAKLREAGPGSSLRRAAATALTLGALHRARQLEASRRQEKLMDVAQQTGAKDFTPRHLQNTPLDGVTSEAGLTPEQRELLAFLKDAAMPAELRAAYVQECVEKFPRLFDPPLFIAAVDLLPASGSTAAGGFDAGSFAKYLAAMPQYFPAAADGSDRAALAKLAHLLLPQARYEPDGTALLLAVRSGSEEAVLRIVRTAAGRRQNPLSGIFRVLVNHRQFSAAQWIMENAADELLIQWMMVRRPDELYRPDSPQALRDFQAALPDGPLRTVARVVMECAEDSPELAGTETPFQAQRMKVLLAALPAERLPVEWLRRLRRFFEGRREFEQVFQTMLGESMEGASVQEMLQADEETRKLFLGHLARQAQLGKMSALAKTLDEILATPGEHLATAWELLNSVRAANQRTHQWPVEEDNAVRAMLRRGALDPALQLKDKPAQMAYLLAECLAIHAATDAMTEMEAAWQAVPAEHRAMLESLPQVVPFILQHIHNPVADRFSGSSVPALPADLIARREDALLRLVQSDFGLPGLLPGDLSAWEAQESDIYADAPPTELRARLCALAPALAARRDRQALAALPDVALLLVKEKKPDEARKLMPALAEALVTAPPAMRVPAFAMHFALRQRTESAEAALAWALQNAALLRDGATPDAARAIAALHTALNLAEAALLKASGQAAWEKSVAARLSAAPESPLAMLHAAWAMEKVGEALAAAGQEKPALAAMSRAVQLAERVRREQPELLDQGSREIFLANWANLAQRAGEEVKTMELAPLRSKWEMNAVIVARPARSAPRRSDTLQGEAPLGWNAEDVATKVPDAWRQHLEVKSVFNLEAADLPGMGCLFAAVAGTGAPFSLNGAVLTWSDSGRPERTLPLDFLASDQAAAKAYPGARLTLCGPQWLREGKNEFSFTLVQPEPVADSFRFDAALYALRLTWAQAVERSARTGAPEPDIWRQLPSWMQRGP